MAMAFEKTAHIMIEKCYGKPSNDEIDAQSVAKGSIVGTSSYPSLKAE